jgi:hypothetical protein
MIAGQSFNHDEKNVNVAGRGFRGSSIVICHARASMLPLDPTESADQDKGVCEGAQCLQRQFSFSVE